jgi:hypothetical protein
MTLIYRDLRPQNKSVFLPLERPGERIWAMQSEGRQYFLWQSDDGVWPICVSHHHCFVRLGRWSRDEYGRIRLWYLPSVRQNQKIYGRRIKACFCRSSGSVAGPARFFGGPMGSRGEFDDDANIL